MIAVMWLPVVAMAQNDWEVPDKVETTTTSTTGTTTAAAIPNPDAKYLTGAVPVKDGKVVFEQTINAPGRVLTRYTTFCWIWWSAWLAVATSRNRAAL